MARWLHLGFVTFLGLALLSAGVFGFLATTTTGLRWLAALTGQLSGGMVTVGTVAGTLLGPIHLQNIRYTDGVDTVTIGALDLDWAPGALFNGTVHIRSLEGREVGILLGPGSGGETRLVALTLPGRFLLDTVAVAGLRIDQEGQTLWQVHKGMLTQLIYQGGELQLRTIALENEILQLEATGQIRTTADYPLSLTGSFAITPPNSAPIKATAAINGPLNGLRVSAQAQSPFPARLQGELRDLLNTTTWQAKLESPEVQLSAINSRWPAQLFTQVQLSGYGDFSRYTVDLDGRAELPQLDTACLLNAHLQGDADGLYLDHLHLSHGASRLVLQGAMGWMPNFSWDIRVKGERLDPGLFFADWPGQFNTDLTTSGKTTDAGLVASLHLTELTGTLRGLPVSGNAEAELAGAGLKIPFCRLTSGKASFQVSGSVADEVALSFRLQADNLAELWPKARGSLQTQGRLSGTRAATVLEASLKGADLTVADWGAQQLSLTAKGILAPEGTLNATLQGTRLRLGDLLFTQGQLRGTGSLRTHTVEFEGHGEGGDSGFRLQGSVQEQHWQGQLSQTHLSSPRWGSWRQQRSARLAVAADKAEAESLCLNGPANASICADGRWQTGAQGWQFTAKATNIALAQPPLAGVLPPHLSGMLAVTLALKGQGDQLQTGTLHATGTEMRLALPSVTEIPPLGWTSNQLHLVYSDGRLQANLDSTLADTSTIQAQLSCATAQLTPRNLLRAPLSGNLQLRLKDLRLLTAFTQQVAQLSGSLNGQFDLAGTPVSPVLKGQMELVKGQAEILPLGITLTPLQCNIIGDNVRLRMVATAQSGKGPVHLEGSVATDQLATGPYTLHLSGDSFQAAHIPGLDLEISPDLELSYQQQQFEAKGTISIPNARITSIDWRSAAVQSDDIVVIDEPPGAITTLPVQIRTDVTLIAGKDVRIDAYGLRGRIEGQLAVHSQPGRPQIGNGTLSVLDGSFSIYGRRLNIGLGRLLFTGGPLANPGVELRSERKTEQATTGVFIDGFLQRPEMHFYSSPVMDQSAILVNLLESTAIGGETRQDTGFIGTAATTLGLGGLVPYLQGVKQLTMIDEIKLESGQENDTFSLVFGSWLTPNFYVSYGKDLVKESGSFNTKLLLGEGFSFLTETGATSSGGDIKYEFER